LELIADCLSGVWAYAVFLDGYLEPGDVDEALQAVAAIGDADVTIASHGTGAQRQNAWLIGYQGSMANPVPGTPANCITAYWSEWGQAAQ
jgi:predicted metalloprotease